ncbi:MAG: bestrophin [Planctomycetaceae bacterium]|nr:bestrophin [Planctomycetaceae bacterium]
MPIRESDLDRLVKTSSMLMPVWGLSFVLGLYSLIPVFKEYSSYDTFADFPSDIFSVLGLVLSLILVFRTNRAYDRWWEARTLWGKQVNVSRNVAIKCRSFANLDDRERTLLHRWIAGFAFALKDHLRRGAVLKELPGWSDSDSSPEHVPSWLSGEIYRSLKDWEREGRISPQELLAIDTDLHEFLNVCGGCERIRNTLIAGSYRSYAIKCLILYFLTLPWGLVQDLQWLTVPVTMILTYIMFGLESIADAVEEPFGDDLDDLNLEELCRTIDRTTAEVLSVPAISQAET